MWSGLVSEALRGEAEGTDVNPDPLVTLETKLKVLQICANIVDYCRVAMTMGGDAVRQNPKFCDVCKFSTRKGIFLSVLSYYLLS